MSKVRAGMEVIGADGVHVGTVDSFANGRIRLQPDEIAGAQSHTYELTPPIVRGWFGGDDYIRHLVLPDFFFHISIAHAILRHLGAKIRKRHYPATSVNRVAATTRERRARCRARVEASTVHQPLRRA